MTQVSVECLDYMGDDLAIANAARVSFNKESTWDTVTHYSFDPDANGGMGGHDEIPVEQLSLRDSRLIAYLAKHNHWTPFAQCYLKFRIKAPIPVARQLLKHTVGLAVNEVSRRYVSYTPEVYVPDVWRRKATDKKQGSSKESVQHADNVRDLYTEAVSVAKMAYEDLLSMGVCEEQARLVLPQGALTEWVWSGSLAAFLRVIELRTSDDAQKETRDVAELIAEYVHQLFPVAAEAWASRKSHE